MPEFDRRYTVSLYFDQDNPTGARLLYGRTYKTRDGKYKSRYNFQISPEKGLNQSCDEYPDWDSDREYDSVWEALVTLDNAIDTFQTGLRPLLRAKELDARILALKIERDVAYSEATAKLTELLADREAVGL